MMTFHIADEVPVFPLLEALAKERLGFSNVPGVGLTLCCWPTARTNLAVLSASAIRAQLDQSAGGFAV